MRFRPAWMTREEAAHLGSLLMILIAAACVGVAMFGPFY